MLPRFIICVTNRVGRGISMMPPDYANLHPPMNGLIQLNGWQMTQKYGNIN